MAGGTALPLRQKHSHMYTCSSWAFRITPAACRMARQARLPIVAVICGHFPLELAARARALPRSSVSRVSARDIRHLADSGGVRGPPAGWPEVNGITRQPMHGISFACDCRGTSETVHPGGVML